MIAEIYSIPDITWQNCGSINDFRTVMKSNQNTAWCNGCDKFIKNMPQGKPPVLHFGKYKDRLISTMLNKEEVEYLTWLSQQSFCKNNLKTNIENHIKNL